MGTVLRKVESCPKVFRCVVRLRNQQSQRNGRLTRSGEPKGMWRNQQAGCIGGLAIG